LLASFIYLALRRLIELVLLRPRSRQFKELEIVVLRHSARSCAAKSGVPSFSPRIEPSSPPRAVCCVETVALRRIYVFFFIEFGSRRVHLAGCSATPNGAWVAQQARNLAWSLRERERPLRFLIHDRDRKFTDTFDEVFRSEGIEIIRTPIRAPKANAIAERFVGTVRRECLDWIVIFGRRQLERVLRVFVDHYDSRRPHRALGLAAPVSTRPAPRLVGPPERCAVRRRDRLSGLIHECSIAA
jgi:putative transposase